MLSMQKVILQLLVYTIHCSCWTEASHPALGCKWNMGSCGPINMPATDRYETRHGSQASSHLSRVPALPYMVTGHFEPQQWQKNWKFRRRLSHADSTDGPLDVGRPYVAFQYNRAILRGPEVRQRPKLPISSSNDCHRLRAARRHGRPERTAITWTNAHHSPLFLGEFMLWCERACCVVNNYSQPIFRDQQRMTHRVRMELPSSDLMLYSVQCYENFPLMSYLVIWLLSAQRFPLCQML